MELDQNTLTRADQNSEDKIKQQMKIRRKQLTYLYLSSKFLKVCVRNLDFYVVYMCLLCGLVGNDLRYIDYRSAASIIKLCAAYVIILSLYIDRLA